MWLKTKRGLFNLDNVESVVMDGDYTVARFTSKNPPIVVGSKKLYSFLWATLWKHDQLTTINLEEHS